MGKKIIKALDILRMNGCDITLHNDVIVCVVPADAVVYFSLAVIREHAAEVRERLKAEAAFYEREMTVE